MNKKSKQENDDMFTDEQPSKEAVLKGEEKSIPLLESGWGSYGDYRLVGNGEVTNGNCGKRVSLKGCLQIEKHNVTTLDGVNYAGKVFVNRVTFHCDKPSCPVCYKRGWAIREAGRIEARITEASKRFGQPEHVVVSVPVKDYGFDLPQLRKKAVNVTQKRGVVGGCFIFHGFRYRQWKGWYFNPHFHCIGFILGGYAICRNCKRKSNCDSNCNGFDSRAWKLFQEDGWYVKVMGKRKTIFGTAWYQLNYASYAIGGQRHTVATWFGNCSYRKLKVTPEVRKKLCPICQSELVRIQYSGKKRLYLSEEDDTFEDYLEDGDVVWVVVKKRKRIVGARHVFTPEDFANPVSQDRIDEIFPKRLPQEVNIW